MIPFAPEPVRCPQCHRREETRRTCRHCDYEYPVPSGDLVALAVGLFAVVALELFTWALHRSACGPFRACHTFVEHLAAQAAFVGELVGNLW